ncbi:MAG: NAD(P)H-hydrate dehydratase [Bacteroidales bacterium]|nr:NAD(P)H-hydrate dehydratase [Bacteroidales bacterium]MDE6537857.1 NAD(P)H-hydrate dehydratase [Muribaculaceae bacterium]
MKILSSEAIRELDMATCHAQGISTIDLMERAASAVTVEIISRFLPSRRIVVMAGPGNNGGDALAVARMLYEQGYKNLEIYLFNVDRKLSHDCLEQRNKIITIDGINFTEVTKEFTPPVLGENDVVIDGLFGSGLKRPLDGGFGQVAKYINGSGAYVISIDIPTGLYGEWNSWSAQAVRSSMVHANLTLAFQVPRLTFFFEENYEIIGEWKLLDIDLDDAKMKDLETQFYLLERRNIRPLIKPRHPFTGKRDYGSTLFFTGSTGLVGASILSSRTALKSGAGLATVHGPRGALNIMQTAAPEVMFEPDRNEHFITDMTVHHHHQVVVAGPGIGTHDQTVSALEGLLKNVPNMLLLDADALNCIAKRPALLTMLPPNKTVITPHIGEFDRLFGDHFSSEERLRTAIDMAHRYKIVIVLKGHNTMVVRPTGRVYINSTGNPGMATAGSGDVLAGVIGAFLAQGYSPEQAATIGVYVHGLAGDLAVDELGEFGIVASDIADHVGRAIKMVMER